MDYWPSRHGRAAIMRSEMQLTVDLVVRNPGSAPRLSPSETSGRAGEGAISSRAQPGSAGRPTQADDLAPRAGTALRPGRRGGTRTGPRGPDLLMENIASASSDAGRPCAWGLPAAQASMSGRAPLHPQADPQCGQIRSCRPDSIREAIRSSVLRVVVAPVHDDLHIFAPSVQ